MHLLIFQFEIFNKTLLRSSRMPQVGVNDKFLASSNCSLTTVAIVFWSNIETVYSQQLKSIYILAQWLMWYVYVVLVFLAMNSSWCWKALCRVVSGHTVCIHLDISFRTTAIFVIRSSWLKFKSSVHCNLTIYQSCVSNGEEQSNVVNITL